MKSYMPSFLNYHGSGDAWDEGYVPSIRGLPDLGLLFGARQTNASWNVGRHSHLKQDAFTVMTSPSCEIGQYIPCRRCWDFGRVYCVKRDP